LVIGTWLLDVDPDRANIPHYLKAGLYAISIWIWAHPRPLQTSNSQMPGFFVFWDFWFWLKPDTQSFLFRPSITYYTLHVTQQK
jgi:hypothetical protein